MKRYLIYLLPAITVLFVVIISILSMPFGIDSLYDEGQHCLSIQKAMNGDVEGGSQWATLITCVLGNNICSSVLALRVIGLILPLFTAIFFWLLTKNNRETAIAKLSYLIMILFFLTPCLGGIVICYNEISQFLLVLSCGFLYKMYYNESKSKTYVIWAMLLGAVIMLSFFVILPSAVVIGFSSLILIVIKYWKDKKNMLSSFLLMFLGACLIVLLFNFCIVDLETVFGKMSETAKTITKVSRGYDPLSFIIKILLFLRDVFFCLITLVGILFVSYEIRKRGAVLLSSVFCIAAIFVYWYWQKNPALTISMLMMVLWWQFIIRKIIVDGVETIKISKDAIFNIYLCVFPLFAALGTNVYLGGKIMWYLIPWALLFWRLNSHNEDNTCIFKKETIAALSIILLIIIIPTIKTIDFSEKRVERGMFRGMYLTNEQYNHFSKAENIMSCYSYKRGSSVVFSTQLSMATLCYLEAVPCGSFFQPMDFVAQSNKEMESPDFLFLTQFDEKIAGETLKNMSWGWPEDFDKYYVGTPEVVAVPYSTERWLYCRKSLKNK